MSDQGDFIEDDRAMYNDEEYEEEEEMDIDILTGQHVRIVLSGLPCLLDVANIAQRAL
jgi:hypothetical protein